MAYPETDVIILCFSVVRPDSMENIVTKWLPELNKFIPDVLIVLVGTQCDLRDNNSTIANIKNVADVDGNNNNLNNTNNKPRHISTREGEELRQKIKAYKYIECSAITQLNIKEIFDTCCEAYANSQKKKVQPSCFQTLFRRLTSTIRRRLSFRRSNARSSGVNSSGGSQNGTNQTVTNTNKSRSQHYHES
jgi:GTPase SAR1 family protein